MKSIRSRRRRSLRSAPLALAVLLATGCDRPPATPVSAPEQPISGGTAVVAVTSDITGINPLLDGSDSFNRDILDAMFLQLFEEQPDFAEGPPTFAPELAGSWQWSDDGRELAIELRPDIRWSDGVPLTAADVVWTWQMQTDDRLGWRFADSKRSIAAIEAVDTLRLRVEFDKPSTTSLADLNQGHILPRHRWGELPVEQWRGNSGWFRDHQVVSGPFRLAEWQPDQQIVLERNPAYYRDGFPRLDRVVFRIVPDPGNQLSELLSGAVDFLVRVPQAAAARVEANPDTRLESFWARQYTFIHWNLARPMFAEVEARQALTLAIDRQKIIDTLWFDRAAIASSPIISTVWAHRAGLDPWPHDRARSRSLLAGLGWRDEDGDGVLERDGRRFSFEILVPGDNRTRTDAAVMIQEDLRQIGVDVRVRRLEYTTLVAELESRDFDAALSAFSIDTSLDLAYAFSSRSIADGYNFGGYSNPEVDRLIDAAGASRDPSEQGRLLGELQELLHHDQPFTFLWEPQRLHGVSRRLHGVQPNPLSSLRRLEEWWLAPAA